MISKGKAFLVLALMLLPFSVFAGNGQIKGKVTDSSTGDGLPGANVLIEGTTLGAASDAQGNFVIYNVPPGTYTVKATYIGYNILKKQVQVNSDETATVDFALEPQALVMEGVYVTASRAKERETPVAFTDVDKEIIQANLGSRDIPLVLNTTPSVYATPQGGGSGDARINIRGFDQRNVAIMINGVPVNDMENGWVYWSNWDGVGDVTSSIQVQRGLSAVNLAVPSIGGTMNILTDPTALERGGLFKQEIGSDGFLKSTLVFNSGLINDKLAVSAAVVRKLGDGIIDATWTDAWAYYFGASYNINQNNRLEFYALGAPQRHGQNLYKQNIAVYDTKFAASLPDYDPMALTKYNQAGRRFNQNWAPVDPNYNGKQMVDGKAFDRYDKAFINERENFYHKPQVNLNWYSKFTEKVGLFTVLYYSGGRGGGTGTYGRVDRKPWVAGNKWYASAPWTWDWNSTIAKNSADPEGRSRGILRNSRNNQWTVGVISKASIDFSPKFKMIAGIDWRTAEIEHYREVRDLLGGQYYIDVDRNGNPASDFWSMEDARRKLGDRIAYDFKNDVDWLGVFAQGEYRGDAITAYGMAGYSTIKYRHTNYFRKDANGNVLVTESPTIGGYQAKGGASYRLGSFTNIYANVGYVSKVPIFDNVINDRTGQRADNPKNEKFTSVEFGVNFTQPEARLDVKLSAYYTLWKDRARSVNVTNADGSEGIIFITGMNILHQGIELEAAYQLSRYVRLDGAVSVANWEYVDDVSGVYKDYESGGALDVQYSFYVKGLKVGDAPQTQFALTTTVYPTQASEVKLVWRHYRDHYANWDPFSRTNPEDRVQSWKIPNYSVVDLHASYALPFTFGNLRPKAFLHVFNLLDAVYIQDATDNSRYNAWDKDHDADDAAVFMGLPRFFNAGISIDF
ncbi:MAG: TonB-dependent receptor [candidate division KSB1 bacterium]|nr:TonB-dependent receptor [candidate division KSB1 bacterium]